MIKCRINDERVNLIYVFFLLLHKLAYIAVAAVSHVRVSFKNQLEMCLKAGFSNSDNRMIRPH